MSKPGDIADTAAEAAWRPIPTAFRKSNRALPPPWEAVFGPLRNGSVDDLMLVAQCGQSIDARIATLSGHSRYINSEAGLIHLHRLRALVDAVVIGVSTAVNDDPQLTVRRVQGPNPARVIIDPRARLPSAARVLAADGARRLLVSACSGRIELPADIELVQVPIEEGAMPPAAIARALRERGLRRILIEGGATTVSRFLAARCLDRLHIVIAPIILGSGRASLSLPTIERVDEALPAPMRAHLLGEDVLLDCDLSAQRVPIGQAKKSR